MHSINSQIRHYFDSLASQTVFVNFKWHNLVIILMWTTLKALAKFHVKIMNSNEKWQRIEERWKIQNKADEKGRKVSQARTLSERWGKMNMIANYLFPLWFDRHQFQEFVCRLIKIVTFENVLIKCCFES